MIGDKGRVFSYVEAVCDTLLSTCSSPLFRFAPSLFKESLLTDKAVAMSSSSMEDFEKKLVVQRCIGEVLADDSKPPIIAAKVCVPITIFAFSS